MIQNFEHNPELKAHTIEGFLANPTEAGKCELGSCLAAKILAEGSDVESLREVYDQLV